MFRREFLIRGVVAAAAAAAGGGGLLGRALGIGDGLVWADDQSRPPLPDNVQLIDSRISRAYMEAIREEDGVRLAQILQEIASRPRLELELARLPIHAGIGFHGPSSASLIVGSQGPEFTAEFKISAHGVEQGFCRTETPKVKKNQIQFICYPFPSSPGRAGAVTIEARIPQQGRQLSLLAMNEGMWREEPDTSGSSCAGTQWLQQQALNGTREIMFIGQFHNDREAVLQFWASHDPGRIETVLLPSERIVVLDFPEVTNSVAARVTTADESWLTITNWLETARRPWPISPEPIPQPD